MGRRKSKQWRNYAKQTDALLPGAGVRLKRGAKGTPEGLQILRQARREPHRGPGKHSRGSLKHFHVAPLEKNLNFSFQNGTFLRTLYFWLTAGPPKRRGARVAYPSTPPFRRACSKTLFLKLYCSHFLINSAKYNAVKLAASSFHPILSFSLSRSVRPQWRIGL